MNTATSKGDTMRQLDDNPDYSRAFHDGVDITYTLQNDTGSVAEQYTVHVHTMGELVVTSGHILACDPELMFETPSFADTVPPGRYPVILSVAGTPSTDHRVPLPLLHLRQHTPLRCDI